MWEFCERVDARAVNRRATECLIKCGAFDSTGATRKVMLEALPHAQANGQKAQEDAQRGQSSIFDLGGVEGDATSAARQHPPLIGEEFDSRELLRLEAGSSARSSPSIRCRRCATRSALASTARSRTSRRRPTGRG